MLHSKNHSDLQAIQQMNLDADDPLDESSDEEDDNHNHNNNNNAKRQHQQEGSNTDDDDDDDDEDDTAALMIELARIKKERAAEAAKQEQEKRLEDERIRMENILKGNPLLNSQPPKAQLSSQVQSTSNSSEFRVKRRWDDDVVFKNCAKSDIGKRPQFINDSLRSEFHKRFMEKYIK